MPMGNLPANMQNVFATSLQGAGGQSPVGAPAPANAFTPEKMGLAQKIVGVLAPDAYFDAKDAMDRRNLGGMAASGDLAGARDTAMRAGNFQGAEYFDKRLQSMTEQQKEALKPKFGLISQAAGYLLQVPPEQRGAEYQRLAPQLAQMGLDPNTLDPSQLTDENLGRAVEMGYRFGGVERPDGPEYFAPTQVIGPDGKPMLVQASKGGGVQAMEGYAPYEKPETLTPYQEAQLGLQRDRLEFDRTRPRGPQTVVNVNPAGSQAVDDLRIGGKGKEESVVRGLDNEPIVVPGEQAQLYNKTKNSIVSRERREGLVTQDIGRALELSEQAFTTGLPGGVMSAVPGTPAYDLGKVVNGIVANIGFDELATMRANSPTGGALGSVTERELEMLQSVTGSMQQSQSKEQFQFHLARLKQIIANSQADRRAAFAQDFPSLRDYNEFRLDTATASAQSRSRPAPAAGTVQDGYEFLGGDPSKPESWRQVQ